MLHNIFKKRGKEKIKEKPLIIADIHEKNSLVLSELISSKEIILEISSLKIADYVIGTNIIERKTISDFISSMISKRLIQQLKQMQEYPKKLLIIEGDINQVYKENSDISGALRGFIISLLMNYQMPLLFSEDCKDTAQYLITLAKQQKKTKSPISLHSRIPKTKEEQKKYVLEAFPGIGPKKSEKLLEKLPNLLSIFNASEEELKDILKSKAGEFKNLLNS
ncbi:hypothetical protein J4221_04245 [Candidatus Pacearchaeota archaeon]|nr:hypothetical protein [Candidatus Pacearchaeota archaeon]